MSTDVLGKVTPYRRSHVFFDTPETVLGQPAVSYERMAYQMARTTSYQVDSLFLHSGMGWRIGNYFEFDNMAGERTVAQSGFLTVAGGLFTVASGIVEAPRFRKVVNADVTGIDTGGSSGVAATALNMFRKLWADTDNVSTLKLAADQTAFPSPDTANDSYVMDRHGVSTNQYSAGTADFAFIIDIPGQSVQYPDKIATIYFPGPATQTQADTGRGEYALILMGTGTAYLYERTTATNYPWVKRTSMQYATAGNVYGRTHSIRISQTTGNIQNGGPGGAIIFRMGDWAQSPHTLVGAMATAGIATITLNSDQVNQHSIYAVARYNTDPVSSVPCCLRVDTRRDLRGIEFAVAVPKFFPTGALADDAFYLGTPITQTTTPGVNDLTLVWYADVPGDSTLELKLYNAQTGALLTETSYNALLHIKTYEYSGDLIESFYVTAEFTSTSDFVQSPCLKSYKLFRSAQGIDSGTTQFEFVTPNTGTRVLSKVISGFDITGAEKDITHELATIRGADLLGDYTPLRTRSGMPVEINTEYDEADPTKRLWLFSGYVTPSDTVPMTGTNRTISSMGLPGPNAYEFELHVAGKWKRLQEQSFQVIQQMFLDTASTTYKVTDLVRDALGWGGFPPSMIDVPDNPMRLYGKGGTSFFGFEPYANVLDTIQKLLLDYLGWFLVFDRNVGTYGKWRALPQVRGPYTNVAAFITTGPPQNDGSKRLVHSVKSYPLASTLGDGKTYTATAPTIYINKGTLHRSIIEPEGNLLYFSVLGGPSEKGPLKYLTQCRPNMKSYNFNPDVATADPTSRDFLGRCKPIYYLNPSLAGLAGSDWEVGQSLNRLFRRIFDIACHGVEILDFEAPIVPLDNEAEAGKVRTLRYYDPVTIDGVQYVIRNFNPRIEHDLAQSAMIQAELPNF